MKVLRSILWIFIVLTVTSEIVQAETTPTDVYHLAQKLEADVNLIRLEMGVPKTNKADIAITNAQPREVYFQAVTLFEKSNRLLFERLRERAEFTPVDSVNLTPEHVLSLLSRVSVNVSRVKKHLGIIESVTQNTSSMQRTPTDVFKLIVRINRSLNTLLLQLFEPADVYQNITYSISLTYEILVTTNSREPLGKGIAFARKKTPTDVYRNLLKIYSIIEDIFARSGQPCLTIETAEAERSDINPGDVYDLASLLVSELTYLHSRTRSAGNPKSAYYPGEKLPSHVFQRAGRLESQLKSLREFVFRHPNWLDS